MPPEQMESPAATAAFNVTGVESEEFEKGDMILVTPSEDTSDGFQEPLNMVKAETVEGKVTAYYKNADDNNNGSVTVDGKNIFSLKDEALTIFRRRKIGFVFQSFNLVPVLTVRENIVLPIQLDGGKVDERYVGEVVTALGLEKKLNSLPGQLSGGQQQRVAIARALATKPAVLLADEPTGNLDSRTSQDVLSLMKVTGRKFSQTMVMITHNEEIAQLSDRIVRIEDGRIVTQ